MLGKQVFNLAILASITAGSVLLTPFERIVAHHSTPIHINTIASISTETEKASSNSSVLVTSQPPGYTAHNSGYYECG